MHKRQWDTVLYRIAEDQAGYFTAAQARAAGLHQVRLVQLAEQEDIERVSRGVYRVARFPVSRFGHYMEAVLWPQVRRPDIAGVISHQSALAIHELSDVSPARVHLTLPTAVRIRREVPKGLVIHHADLASDDVERVEGVPVTTPARSIRDAHASHLGNELVAQAIADGRRSGALSMAPQTDWRVSCSGPSQALDGRPAQSWRRDDHMTAGRKRPTGPPPSAGVLARYAQAYARELGVAEGRVRVGGLHDHGRCSRPRDRCRCAGAGSK